MALPADPVTCGDLSGLTVSDRYDNHGTFTTTFTGEVTPAFTGGSGAMLTGHLALWNGGSFDKQNMVMHATTNFQGTDQNGNPVLFHAVDHASTSAAGVPNFFDIATCR